MHEQVVEVEQEAVRGLAAGFVAGVDGGDLFRVRRQVTPGAGRTGSVILGGEQRRLRPLDLGGEITHGLGAGPQPDPAGGLADERELAVEQAPLEVAHHLRPEVAQLAQRRGVEGPGLHLRGLTEPEGAQPRAHLPRGAGGERHREHLAGGDMPGLDQVRDAVRDGARLARARTGEDAQRAARGAYGDGLVGIESGWCGHVRHHPSGVRHFRVPRRGVANAG